MHGCDDSPAWVHGCDDSPALFFKRMLNVPVDQTNDYKGLLARLHWVLITNVTKQKTYNNALPICEPIPLHVSYMALLASDGHDPTKPQGRLPDMTRCAVRLDDCGCRPIHTLLHTRNVLTLLNEMTRGGESGKHMPGHDPRVCQANPSWFHPCA